MKGVLKKAIAVIIVILSFSGVVWAGDSVTFTMSCTIPAIPGVNAPLVNDKIDQKDTTVAQGSNKQIEIEKQEPATIEEIRLAQGATASAATKTIYSR